MARFFHEYRSNFQLGNGSDNNVSKPYACIVEYHLYRCYNSQSYSVVQRRPPRHLLEAWYFWLGIVLLVVSAISLVSISSGRNARIDGNRRNDREFNQPRANQNQISISIIPSTFSSQRKMLVIGAQPNSTHMSKKAMGATPLLCETKSWITKSRSANAMEPSASPRVLVPWPKLKCCNSHDYCNADNDDDDDDDDNDDDDDDDDDDEDDDGHNNDDDTHNDDDDDDDDDDKNASTWTHEKKIRTNQTRFTMDRGTPMNGPRMSTNSDTTLQPDQKYDRKYENSTESYDRLLQNRIRALHVAALVLAVATLISVLASCYVITRFLRHNRYTMDTVNYS
ncbi:hypothetical protein P5V15_006476 [Pogonomyrmex californicus]